MVSAPTTNLHCASHRRARSRCGSTAACTCPRPSPRCNGRHWPAASSLSWPAPPSAVERVSHWRPGSSGLGWGPLGGERRDTKNGERNEKEKDIKQRGQDKGGERGVLREQNKGMDEGESRGREIDGEGVKIQEKEEERGDGE